MIVSQFINTIDDGPVPVSLPVSTLSTLSTISYYRYKSGIVFEYHFPGYSSTRYSCAPAAQRTLATRSRRDRARAPCAMPERGAVRAAARPGARATPARATGAWLALRFARLFVRPGGLQRHARRLKTAFAQPGRALAAAM